MVTVRLKSDKWKIEDSFIFKKMKAFFVTLYTKKGPEVPVKIFFCSCVITCINYLYFHSPPYLNKYLAYHLEPSPIFSFPFALGCKLFA